MKRSIIALLIALLAFVSNALGKWAYVPLEELLQKTDIVVVARLADVQEWTKEQTDYGSGVLIVIEAIQGNAKVNDKLKLEWSNFSGLSCPRVEHAWCQGKTMIWLLQKSGKGVVRADYPGRVLELTRRDELDEVLKQK